MAAGIPLAATAVCALLIVGGLYAGGVIAPVSASAADIATREADIDGWKAHVEFAGGAFQGTRFHASGMKDGQSEAITVRAWVQDVAIAPKGIKSFTINVYLNDKLVKSQYVKVANSPAHSGEIALAECFVGECPKVNLPSLVFPVQNSGSVVATGVLRAELLLEMPNTWYGTTMRRGSTDEANLVDGSGSFSILSGQGDVFAEGDVVKISGRSGHGNWFLEVFPPAGISCGSTGGWATPVPNGGKLSTNGTSCSKLMQWSGASAFTGSFRIPKGAFVAGMKDARWWIILRNEYVDHAASSFFTVDNYAKMPEAPKVTHSPSTPKVNEVFRLSMEARGNPTSGANIVGFRVYAWYGTAQQEPVPTSRDWIHQGHEVQSRRTTDGSRYTGSVDIVVQQPSFIQYRVISVDSAGRVSGSTISGTAFKALEEAGMEDPNTNSRGEVRPEGSSAATTPGYASPPEQLQLLHLVLVLSLAVGIILGASRYLPGSPYYKLAAYMIIAGAAFLLILQLPGVEGW